MWCNGDTGLEELKVGQLYCAGILREHTKMHCRSNAEGFGKSLHSCILGAPGAKIRMQVAQGNRQGEEVREQGRNEDHIGWCDGKNNAWRVLCPVQPRSITPTQLQIIM